MIIIVPDLDWYSKKSLETSFPPRCPFSSVKSCPRYYQSLSLLGEAGSTKIDISDDKRLLKFWKKNDLWPKTCEQETSISGPTDHINHFNNFCPEVAFERFGFFASHLSRYSDEIDQKIAHKKLRDQGSVLNDWRWAWALLSPMHYLECPLYSVINHRSMNSNIVTKDKESWYKKPLGIVILGILVAVIGGYILAWIV